MSENAFASGHVNNDGGLNFHRYFSWFPCEKMLTDNSGLYFPRLFEGFFSFTAGKMQKKQNSPGGKVQKPTGEVPTVPVKNELDHQQSTKVHPTGVTDGKHQYPTNGHSPKTTSGKLTNTPAAGAKKSDFWGICVTKSPLYFLFNVKGLRLRSTFPRFVSSAHRFFFIA